MTTSATTLADDPQIRVPFVLSSPGARTVSLAIFFNQAQRTSPGSEDSRRASKEELVMMVRDLVPLQQAKPGLWRCEVSLSPGWYEYLFLVDGAWVMDPDAQEVRPDGAGGFNAARKVEPPVSPPITAAAPAAASAGIRRPSALRRAG